MYKIKSLVDVNRRITTKEIAEKLNLLNAAVHKTKKRLGLISMLDKWVYPVLTERNLLRRISDCDLLIKGQKSDPQECKAQEIMV